MRKKRYKGVAVTAIKRREKILDKHNVENYYSDIEYIGRLCVSQSTKEWIETNMYVLRGRSNIYENNVGAYLYDKKIKFIHQAPFVFSGKIYFADFYLPEHRLVIEVDGSYHYGDEQFKYDRERDYQFKSMRIQTMRMSNQETMSRKTIELRLSQYIKCYERKIKKLPELSDLG